MNTVYLSSDFSKVTLPEQCICFPETGLNGEQIREYVCKMQTQSLVIATCSLYLLRELELQKIPATYINDGVVANNCDDVGSIEILDRELEQADRYMDTV